MMTETIPGHILRREICNVIDGFAGRKVHVTFGGTDAFTNGVDEITLPAISHTEVYDLKDARILRGYANHEVAHVRESTVPKRVPAVLRLMGEAVLAKKVEQTKADKLNDLLEQELSQDGKIRLRHLLTTENVFEDYRIEREQGAKFPGSHVNIGVTRDHIVTREATTFLDPDLETGKLTAVAIGHAVGTWLGAIENKYPIAPLAQRLCERIRDEIDPEAYAVIEAAWPRVVKTRSNGDVYPIAADVGDALIAIDVARKQQQKEDEASKKQGQDSGSSASSGGAGAADADGSQSGQGSAPSSNSDEEKPEQAGTAQDGAAGGSQDDTGENDATGGNESKGKQCNHGPSTGGGTTGDQDRPGAGSSAAPKDSSGEQDSSGQSDTAGSSNGQQQGSGSPSTAAAGQQGDPSTRTPSSSGADPTSNSTAPSLSEVYGDVAHDFSDDNGIDIQDVIKRIVKVIGEQAANAMRDRMTAVHGASGAADGITRVVVLPTAEDQIAYRTIAKEARAVSGRVSAAMRSMMIGRARRTERRGLEDGAFDSRALHDIAIGSGSIYKQRSERIRVSGALLLLCDVSASMTDEVSPAMKGDQEEEKTKLDILAEAVTAMSDGLGVNRDVKISLVTYTGDFQIGTIINVHKQFDRPYTAMRAGIGQIKRVKNGGTPTGNALLDALAMMYPRNEKRRVITLITDGVADNPKLAQNAAGCIMKSGIKFTGLGIGKSAPVMKVPDWRNIGDLNDLPNALIDITKRHF